MQVMASLGTMLDLRPAPMSYGCGMTVQQKKWRAGARMADAKLPRSDVDHFQLEAAEHAFSSVSGAKLEQVQNTGIQHWE